MSVLLHRFHQEVGPLIDINKKLIKFKELPKGTTNNIYLQDPHKKLSFGKGKYIKIYDLYQNIYIEYLIEQIKKLTGIDVYNYKNDYNKLIDSYLLTKKSSLIKLETSKENKAIVKIIKSSLKILSYNKMSLNDFFKLVQTVYYFERLDRIVKEVRILFDSDNNFPKLAKIVGEFDKMGFSLLV